MKRGWTDQIRVITAPIPSAPEGAHPTRRATPHIVKTNRPSLGQTLSAGQLGVASVLGLVTIASPLSAGSAAAFTDNTEAAEESALRYATASAYTTQTLSGTDGVSAVQVVSPAGSLQADTTQKVAAQAPDTIIVDKPSRDNERAALPGCDGEVDAKKIESYGNGRLPKSSLCTLWMGGHQLRPDAAVALAKLNIAYKQRFGHELKITDSYRSYDAQVALKKRKPSLAGRPGTSNHGWGMAIDMSDGVQNHGSATYRWMRDNAPEFGWENPKWAQPGGSKFEPWHWEYQP